LEEYPLRISDSDAIAWDVATWSRALRYWEREGRLSHARLECLEVGAHDGGLSVWLAAQGHRVVCSDLNTPQERAKALAVRYRVAGSIRFEEIDATDIPYEDAFDVIAFKSVLGGIGRDGALERQRMAIAAMYRALRSGGRLLFAENLTGSPLHGLLRRRYVDWGAQWRYVTVHEMRSFLEPFSSVCYDTAGFFATLGRTERQRNKLARIDDVIVQALVPPAWRYIMYGIATK